ncbi:alpha/beta hydrolase [Albidovulum salinarum]|uniref:alpha/beta hydrolase n=1 Tax=Albidovulum salinarum TaxID=2984153 RepID=UPI0021E0274D|nr:alpha/beta hydrolase [Defluviimonas sp. WL0024]
MNAALVAVVKPQLRHMSNPLAARRGFERFARAFLARPSGVIVEREHPEEAPELFWHRPAAGRPKVLIYFHGGGYIAGSPRTHHGLLASLAKVAGIAVCTPRYRLAPEHPFPAAQDDAYAAWRHLRQTGFAPRDIALAGDSAGGGLALSLVARLCAEHTPPAAVAVFSPRTDLTGSGASCRTNAGRDPFLPVERLAELAGHALAGHDPRDPLVSPLFAGFPASPPVFFAVSETEVLLDDTMRLARRLEAEGVETELQVSPDSPHAWPIFVGRIPEADATVAQAATFLARHLGLAGGRLTASPERSAGS